MSVNNPTCPAACDSFLEEVDFDFCNPDLYFGEVDHLYVMAQAGANLANWELLAVWNARLALDATADVDGILDLHVIGDYPPAEAEDIVISLNRTITTPATHIINFEIDDVSDDNYEFMRWLECNTLMKLWFSANELIFGGNTGIEVMIKAKYQIERGSKSLQKIIGTVTWESKFSPERTTNPMA